MSDGDTSSPPPEEPFDEIVSEAESVLQDETERQRDEYLDALQRLQADFENYRKRVLRTTEDATSRAAADVISKLLPVVDALDLAQAHFSSEGDEATAAPTKALAQARALLLDTLAKEGLVRIDDVGAPFDPQIHDAVAHVPGDDDSDQGQVVEDILRAGYEWRGTVLRPAMVRVKG